MSGVIKEFGDLINAIYVFLGKPSWLSGAALPSICIYLFRQVKAQAKKNSEREKYIHELRKKHLVEKDELISIFKLQQEKIHGLEKRIDDLNMRG